MRWALSWVLYRLGDAVSRPMERWELYRLYPIYNRLMCWSDDVQGAGPGPWKSA